MAAAKYKNGGWDLMADLKGHSYTIQTDTGSANACAIAPAPALGALFKGYWTWFLPANANTGACTLNPNSLGAKNIFARGAALIGGELSTTVPALVVYDGTQFNLLNPEPASGSFTATLTGMSTTVTGTINYLVKGKIVYCYLTSTIAGTSNANTMTLTGVPTALRPTTGSDVPVYLRDNGVFSMGSMTTASSGTFTFYKDGASATSFTTSGSKGLDGNFWYPLT
jgi:hypothetical protein